ncbi:hypothetical protein [Actinoplanes sp. HUAS TT8]|uniref:hypothetical protein n=1 Tax=Actinoplanes sp. HUAS TT8 TaxID=3447453 RepID=UPI003F526D56
MDIAEAAAALAGQDFGDWTRADLDRVVAALGWPPADPPGKRSQLLFDTGGPAEAHVWPASERDGIATTAAGGMPGITLPADAANGRQAADLALTAIRRWNAASPADLRYHAWVNRKNARLDAHGFRITQQVPPG